VLHVFQAFEWVAIIIFTRFSSAFLSMFHFFSVPLPSKIKYYVLPSKTLKRFL